MQSNLLPVASDPKGVDDSVTLSFVALGAHGVRCKAVIVHGEAGGEVIGGLQRRAGVVSEGLRRGSALARQAPGRCLA